MLCHAHCCCTWQDPEPGIAAVARGNETAVQILSKTWFAQTTVSNYAWATHGPPAHDLTAQIAPVAGGDTIRIVKTMTDPLKPHTDK